MIFNPQFLQKSEQHLILPALVSASTHSCLHCAPLREFFHNFTFGTSCLELSMTENYTFSVGTAKELPLDGYDYSINVEPTGIHILAKSEQTLIHAFMTLLDRFKAVELEGRTATSIECCQIRDRAEIQNRMIHFCVFPETELWELRRFIRFSAALKYTHVILEFWGMLKYDCLKELAWPNGYEKDEVRPIIKEARELGLEVVPMFNHWGHAAQCRSLHGKHVTLDQNPALQTYFSEDGWCWNIENPKVKALLREIRAELIELCGDSSYFHIGCDEAVGFDFTKENMDAFAEFLDEISEEMAKVNRRAIAWGDMFAYNSPDYRYNQTKGRYYCHAPTAEAARYLLDKIDKRIVIADWQYEVKETPIETALTFRDAGFDCMICPWDLGTEPIKAGVKTVKRESLSGIIHTTWHTLSTGTPYILLTAVESFEDCTQTIPTLRSHAASLLRKVMPAKGDYKKAGWSQIQVHSICS